MGAHRDAPKLRLHLAYAHYLNGQWEASLKTLDEVLDEVFALGYDQFLHPIARRMQPMLQFAAKQRPHGEHLADLIRRIEQARPSSAPETLPAPRAVESTPALRIFGFGEVYVQRGRDLIDQRDWGTARAKELLFYLLAYPHRRKDQIGATFWPDLSPAKVRSAFHVTVYRLRRALGVQDCVQYEGDRYYFNQRVDYWYDVQEFERLLVQAERVQSTDKPACEAYLKQAIALYRGDYLESLSLIGVEWHTAQAEALRKKYIDCLLTLAHLASERGEHEAALDYYKRLARKDSFMELAHRGIMESYIGLGDRNAALRHYRELEAHLQRELGVPPTAETVQLYQNILQSNGVA
jgi:two-component SAPR family response regulator